MNVPSRRGRVRHLAGPPLPGVTVALLLAVLLVPACKRVERADTRQLEEAGIGYGSAQQLVALEISNAEIGEVVKVKNAGASEQTCVELLRISRARNRRFASGSAGVALRRAGMSDETILELARLDQLDGWMQEVQTMRRAGISDPIILALARLHAEGKRTLSGSSVAQLKNVGMSEGTILELTRRSVLDNQVEGIVAERRRGMSDSEILRRNLLR